jgi:hypothetical protein
LKALENEYMVAGDGSGSEKTRVLVNCNEMLSTMQLDRYGKKKFAVIVQEILCPK